MELVVAGRLLFLGARILQGVSQSMSSSAST